MFSPLEFGGNFATGWKSMPHDVQGWVIKCSAAATVPPRMLVFGTWSPCGEESPAMGGGHMWVLQPAAPQGPQITANNNS